VPGGFPKGYIPKSSPKPVGGAPPKPAGLPEQPKPKAVAPPAVAPSAVAPPAKGSSFLDEKDDSES